MWLHVEISFLLSCFTFPTLKGEIYHRRTWEKQCDSLKGHAGLFKFGFVFYQSIQI